MELDPVAKITSLVRGAANFIANELRLARDQLADTDLNPHEGKLRASAYMTEDNIPGLIPDFPPTAEDK